MRKILFILLLMFAFSNVLLAQTVVVNGEKIPHEIVNGDVYVCYDYILQFPTVDTSRLNYTQTANGVYLYSLKSLCQQFGLIDAYQSGGVLYVTLDGGKIEWTAPAGLKIWIMDEDIFT